MARIDVGGVQEIEASIVRKPQEYMQMISRNSAGRESIRQKVEDELKELCVVRC
jgi:hypothetical protein